MKKPFYKKAWFWAIVLIVIVGAGAGAGAGGSDNKKAKIDNSGASSSASADQKATTAATTEAPQDTKVKVGGSFETNGLKIKVTDANTDFQLEGDDYGIHDPGEGKKLISVSFDYENISDDDVYVGTTDFKCYADNAECDNEYISKEDDFINTNLSPGRTVSFTLFFKVPTDAKSIELEYSGTFSFDSEKVVVEIQ